MEWILDRLKERSTLMTIITGLAGVTGWVIVPELQEQIIIAVAAIASIIAFATKEEKK